VVIRCAIFGICLNLRFKGCHLSFQLGNSFNKRCPSIFNWRGCRQNRRSWYIWTCCEDDDSSSEGCDEDKSTEPSHVIVTSSPLPSPRPAAARTSEPRLLSGDVTCLTSLSCRLFFRGSCDGSDGGSQSVGAYGRFDPRTSRVTASQIRPCRMASTVCLAIP